ncbi:MAG: hypothetical protein ACETVN_06040 [Asgard group archaeon]
MADWQKKIVENLDGITVSLDDEVVFDGYKCLSECNGLCCFDIQVMVDPFDIFRITRSKHVQENLGITDTTKLYEGEQPLLLYYVGGTSNMPFAIINFRPVKVLGKDVKIKKCPFLVPAFPKLYAEKKGKKGKKGGKARYFVVARAGEPMICALEKAKPTICRSSPIGRALMYSGKDRKKEYRFIYKPPDPKCPACKAEKKVKVRDYVEEWDLINSYKYKDLFFDQICWFEEKKFHFPRDLIYKLGQILYNFDEPLIKNIIETYREANNRTGELEFKELYEVFKKMVEIVQEELQRRTLKQEVNSEK